MNLRATSGILYVRAGLRPFARSIRAAGGVRPFLMQTFDHVEIFSPYFSGARPFWRARPQTSVITNSGALGRLLAGDADAAVSKHPTHSFVGIGPRVTDALRRHDYLMPCFGPVRELAEHHDFSMLLLGCVDDSPGFSTAHAVQHDLGLTQRHLIRYLLRWDIQTPMGKWSMVAPEAPGCSRSFDKFYPAYSHDGNLVEGELSGQRFLYVPSARQAMAVERQILTSNPRFVDCKRLTCTTCRLRLY